jgi:arylsulfatase A-like enzyme
VSQKTIEFLRTSRESGQPFFCWSSFIFPHQPYVPSPKWAAMYPSELMPLPESWNEPVANVPPGLQNWRKNTKVPWNCGTAADNPGIYKRYIAYYYALVSEVDYHLGVILDELEKLGMADNTIVIYTSDHGDFVASHGMVEKCARFHNVYEETVAVPLIVSWPKRFKGGQVCDGLAELIDLYPTLLELTGLPAPKDSLPMPGISLVPTLETGKPIGRKYAITENWSQLTVVTDRYKLGKWIDPSEKEEKYDFRGKHPDMLFDRKADPEEVKNLIGKSGRVEKELRAMLAEWEAKTPTDGRETVLANWRKKGG